jgi:hexosaminidase
MRKRGVAAALATVVVVAAVGIWALNRGGNGDGDSIERAIAPTDVVPAPVSWAPAGGVSFTIADGTPIVAQDAAAPIAEYLAAMLGHGTTVRAGREAAGGSIALQLDSAASEADEGYELDARRDGVTIRARTPAGLFWGVQTLRQLLPANLSGALTVPGGTIKDWPRFAYRGVMLDVARHFFDVAAVKRFIDLSTMYKANYLHLHITDDQGWRIAIDSWPRLTEYGGGSEVGGGAGGFYTKADYSEIVAYAAQRFMTVVPEVDLPGHTNAALASYPELNCDGQAPPRYTGMEVGFSSLCVGKDLTYRFLDDVFGELAALTPGPYLHIGGDEATTLTPIDYATVVTKAQQIVASHGKTAIGWHEMAKANLVDGSVFQYWNTTFAALDLSAAVAAGHKVILSPANHAYLDQKYDDSSPLGLTWAGPTSVEKAYDWDPAAYLSGVDEGDILGVESPLWTETVTSMDDIEYLAFPRLAAIAEIGWSPLATHDWSAFRTRLGAQAPRWRVLGVDFAPADGVPWVTQP